MQQNKKLEKVLNVGNNKIFTCLYLFLHDGLFPKFKEYNQFHIYDNVPSTKNFSMWIFSPL